MSRSRKVLKKIINFFGLRHAVGSIRGFSYILIDAIGTFIFAAGKILGFLPRQNKIDQNAVKNILVVRNDRVGDLVLSTPALRALRKKYSAARIHLLVNRYASDLVAGNPCIDEILIDEKQVLRTKYDLAVALHSGYKQNEILFKSRADWRIGFSGAGGGFFLTEKIKDDRRENPQHEVEFTLKAVQKAGADIDDKRLEVSITAEGESFADKFYQENALADKMIIVIHPGARQENLRWSSKSFARLADQLIEKQKAKIIMTGTLSEKELINDIAAQMDNTLLICLDIKLTQLVSVLKRASMYVGNITGPMHIACAVNIPVLAITGLFDSLDDIRYWGPRCDSYEVVRKQGLESISVDDVYQAVLRLAGKNGS